MKGKSNSRLLIGTAFGVSLGLVIATLSLKGADTNSIGRAMQLTARWSFLFWVAYVARPMAELFGPIFEPLAQRGRGFGLAFAAALVVHLGRVVAFF